jgi:hypothetical protein
MPPEPRRAAPAFSPETLRQLQKVLGSNAPEIIPALATVLQAFPDALTSTQRGKHRRGLDRHLDPLRSLICAIRVVQDDLRNVPFRDQTPVARELGPAVH